MIERNTPSRVLFCILNYGLMIGFGFLCVLPFWHVLMCSISDPRLLMGNAGLVLWPLGKPTLEGYKLVLHNPDIWSGYLNTFLYVIATAVVGTVFTALAGYLVSRKNFKLAKPLALFIMFTMIFSGGTIPLYMVVRNLGMLNTRWSIIIPSLMNAYYVIMMKSAFEQISPAYEEAARIDGAKPLTILFKVLLPMVMPTMVVIIMFTVIMQWNSWYQASIYLPKMRNLWPLQLFMREVLINNDTSRIVTSGSEANAMVNMTGNLVKYCVTVVGTAPILLVYPFAQKYFVKGVTMGGVKE